MELKGTVKLKKRVPGGLVYELKIPGANFVLLRVEDQGLADEGEVVVSIPALKPAAPAKKK